MAYWAACRLQPRRTALALHVLGLRGFETYCPRLRERRARHRRLHEVIKPLFVGYTFVLIQLQWHAARWAPGTLGLIMDGDRPARVPDNVIAELRTRERDGAVELPRRPRPGDRVRILRGPFRANQNTNPCHARTSNGHLVRRCVVDRLLYRTREVTVHRLRYIGRHSALILHRFRPAQMVAMGLASMSNWTEVRNLLDCIFRFYLVHKTTGSRCRPRLCRHK
jgi:transcriptional antiterminator RfaH